MLHGRKLWWVGLVVVLLLATTASAALAQGGNGDKFVFGGSYTLQSGETLNGSLLVTGGSATLEPDSTVHGDVSVAGGSLVVAGHVTGQVNVVGGSVTLSRTAVVDGDLNTIGGSIARAPGAVVRGSTERGTVPRLSVPAVPAIPELGPAQRSNVAGLAQREDPLGALWRAIGRFFGAIGMGLFLALVAVVVILVAPKATAQVATTVADQPGLNFAVGLLTLVLAILVGFPLLIACGLGLLVWLGALLALLYGWVAVGLRVGQGLFNLVKVRTSSSLVEVAVGVFLITWLAWIVPCIGFLFGVVVGSIGLGSVLLTRFGTQRPGGHLAGPGVLGPQSGAPGGGTSAPRYGSLGPGDTGTVTSAERSARETGESTADHPAVDTAPEHSVTRDLQAEPGFDMAPDADIVVEPSRAAEPGPHSLEDLEAVEGISPTLADRLRAAGSTTLVALATSDPETLAAQTGVSADQVRTEDWIGQARRLLG